MPSQDVVKKEEKKFRKESEEETQEHTRQKGVKSNKNGKKVYISK